MEKWHQSEKYIKYSMRVARKALKRRIKRKARLKMDSRVSQGKTRIEIKRDADFNRFNHETAPKNFSFLQNPIKVISFLNNLEKLFKKRNPAYVILKNVEVIDHSSITALLAIMIKFKEARIKFNGDFPINIAANDFLMKSGFFEQLNKANKNQAIYNIGKENQICTHAQKQVVPQIGLPIIEEASLTIWGEKRISKGLQRVLVELMQNTNNHATKEKGNSKHWWLSVNHDKLNKKVSFVFMDYGVGIFSSLNNKKIGNKWYGWQEKIKGQFGTKTDEQVLKLLLDGKMHATVTGEKIRGKGLPSIGQVLDRGQLSNLHIITNNVYADVSGNEYRLLNQVFNGTFYYWELCQDNVNQPWIV